MKMDKSKKIQLKREQRSFHNNNLAQFIFQFNVANVTYALFAFFLQRKAALLNVKSSSDILNFSKSCERRVMEDERPEYKAFHRNPLKECQHYKAQSFAHLWNKRRKPMMGKDK